MEGGGGGRWGVIVPLPLWFLLPELRAEWLKTSTRTATIWVTNPGKEFVSQSSASHLSPNTALENSRIELNNCEVQTFTHMRA